MKQAKEYIIIVAAGSGLRYGAALPKQYCLLDGRPVLMHTLDNMSSALPEAEIILVLHPDYVDYWRSECAKYGFTVRHSIVHGGASRTESVRNALCMVPDRTDAFVYIHDGARPLADSEVTEPVRNALLAGALAVVPATAVSDSLREITQEGTVPADRSRFLAVQTPQGFRADILQAAYAACSGNTTDDATLVQAIFPDIHIVTSKGASYNIKITNPQDIAIASVLRKIIKPSI